MLTSDGALNPIRDLARVETINVSEMVGCRHRWHVGDVGNRGLRRGGWFRGAFGRKPRTIDMPTLHTIFDGDRRRLGAFGREMAKLFSDARDTTEAEKVRGGCRGRFE